MLKKEKRKIGKLEPSAQSSVTCPFVGPDNKKSPSINHTVAVQKMSCPDMDFGYLGRLYA